MDKDKYEVMSEADMRKRYFDCMLHNTCFISLRPLDGKTSRKVMHPAIGEVFVHVDFVK